ncbi:MAG: COX15/CtaA family protein [Polyangiales bacterium]
MSPAQTRFGRYAAFVLAFNLAVILWGAYVRATGSGAGCGDHWPLCNGEVAPRPRDVAMFIEFTHRVTSGLSLLAVVGLVVGAFRSFPKGHPARRGAVLSGGFIVAEALLGAGLVLLRLVANNTSIARAWAHALHLVNTFGLVAALALTVWWGFDLPDLAPRARRREAWLLGTGAAATVLLAVSGGIAALGDTLFPVRSLDEGLAQDLSPTAHILLRLRMWHPVAAVVVGGWLFGVVWTIRKSVPSPVTRALAWVFTGVFLAQLGLGVANVWLLAPVPLQLAHLLVADTLWVVLVFFAAAALSAPAREESAQTVTGRSR